MRFFQRLAPGVRMQHAVQPVLPPRFAGLGDGPRDGPGDGLREDEADAASPPPPGRAATLPQAPEPEPRPLPATAAAAGAERVQAALGEAGWQPVPAATRAEDGVPQPPANRPLPASTHRVGPSPVAAPRGAVPLLPRPLRLDQPSPGPQREPAPPAGAQGDGAVAGPAPQRPLSARALAQRVQPLRNDAPIVHVTIDRIDVRAPAPPPEPRPHTKPRPAPTMSLADYLRRDRS